MILCGQVIPPGINVTFVFNAGQSLIATVSSGIRHNCAIAFDERADELVAYLTILHIIGRSRKTVFVKFNEAWAVSLRSNRT